MEHPRYGIVGRGRLAGHLARYLVLESQDCCTWHRGMNRTADAALGQADIIALAISDDAIEPFLEDHPGLAGRKVIHFSGCRSIDDVPGLHPLMTFGPETYSLEAYRCIPFVTEKGKAAFKDIFPALCNPSWAIDASLKPLYHALCVTSGNFPMLLWSEAFEQFESKLGLPRAMLRPYLERVLENTFQSGSVALTGPLARGDRETVRNNLDALGSNDLAGIYRAFARFHGMEDFCP